MVPKGGIYKNKVQIAKVFALGLLIPIIFLCTASLKFQSKAGYELQAGTNPELVETKIQQNPQETQSWTKVAEKEDQIISENAAKEDTEGKKDTLPAVPESTDTVQGTTDKQQELPTSLENKAEASDQVSQNPKHPKVNSAPKIANQEISKAITGSILLTTDNAMNEQEIKDITGLKKIQLTKLSSKNYQIESDELIGYTESVGDVVNLNQISSKTKQVIESLENNLEIKEAEPDLIWEKFAETNPEQTYLPSATDIKDPFFYFQQHLENTGQTISINNVQSSGNFGKDIQAPQAWKINPGNPNTIIAIIDDGVDITHQDLSPNLLRDSQGIVAWDFIDDDNNPGFEVGSYPGKWGHGTHVAGLAAARGGNGFGVSGSCPNCSILPIRFLGSGGGTTAMAIQAIEYAVNKGAKVINLSWGGRVFSNILQDVINDAIGRGVVVVAAAGNNNSSIQNYPASYPGVISVASTNGYDQKAGFSNYGERIDISAPGYRLLSTVPKGSEIGNECGDSSFKDGQDGYGYCSGTSMSSPLVAGVAGLIKSQNPNLTPFQVKQQIQNNSRNINYENPNYLNSLGSGVVDAGKSLFNLPKQDIQLSSTELLSTPLVVQGGNTVPVSTVKANQIFNLKFVLFNSGSRTGKLFYELKSRDNRLEFLDKLSGELNPLNFKSSSQLQFKTKIKSWANNGQAFVNLIIKDNNNNKFYNLQSVVNINNNLSKYYSSNNSSKSKDAKAQNLEQNQEVYRVDSAGGNQEMELQAIQGNTTDLLVAEL